jgi:arginyl-tRNA synthetase
MRTLEDIKEDLLLQLNKLTQQSIQFTKPNSADFGDFACNIALKLASERKANPQQIATDLIGQLELPAEISKAEVAGPGFINFTLAPDYLLEAISSAKVFLSPDFLEDEKPETILIDYSAPNVAKPLGIHHLLSTVIGQAINNIYKAKAYKTVAINYLGDYGTQFGKVIYSLKHWGNKAEIEAAENPIQELLKLYVRFHEEEEKDESIKQAGQIEFKKLEDGDPENQEWWQWVIDLTIADVKKVYAMLGGIEFDSYKGEAAQAKKQMPILEDGKKEGIITQGEGGAYVIDLEDQGIDTPYLVQKSDGATLYSTRDLATIKDRIEEYHANKCIYVVDVAQKLHFEQLFAAVKKFAWYDPNFDLVHLKFGRMSFADKKMSTRKGNILFLEEVIKEATRRAAEIIEEKNPNLANKEEVARIVGVGSIKYGILNQSPETNIVFSWEKTLTFEGNSAPYLQYSYARAASILRQANFDSDLVNLSGFESDSLEAGESLVIRHLLKFDEVVSESLDKLKPNLIASYLYDLAQIFNSFYTQCPVLKATGLSKDLRLSIVKVFKDTIKQGLHLLGGIEVPEEM